MSGFADAILRWDHVALATSLVAVGIAVARAYRKSQRILGAPALPAERGPGTTSYRSVPQRALTPLHAAYLLNPDILPGMVVLAPLVASGALKVDRRSARLLPGEPGAGLDKYEQMALQQAPNCHMEFVARPLSAQMAAELSADLRNSALQCPEGATGIPRAATAFLWLVSAGLAVGALAVTGPWGGLASAAILLAAYRAHRHRGFAPSTTLSESGWAVLREQERRLDERVRGKSAAEYSSEDIAWYVALKPLPYLRLPGVDENFAPILGDEPPTGRGVEIGGSLSETRRRSARRVNRIRRGVLWTLGMAALLLGLSTLSLVAVSAMFYVNATIVTAVAVRVGVGLVLIRRWDAHLRKSSAFLPRRPTREAS